MKGVKEKMNENKKNAIGKKDNTINAYKVANKGIVQCKQQNNNLLYDLDIEEGEEEIEIIEE
ncbi:MAG: hypothetical protein ABRQ38_08820 [Candidatus Eremiobacterota bacterium]